MGLKAIPLEILLKGPLNNLQKMQNLGKKDKVFLNCLSNIESYLVFKNLQK